MHVPILFAPSGTPILQKPFNSVCRQIFLSVCSRSDQALWQLVAEALPILDCWPLLTWAITPFLVMRLASAHCELASFCGKVDPCSILSAELTDIDSAPGTTLILREAAGSESA